MKAAITGVLAILLLVGWFSFFSDSMTAKDEELSDDELADIKKQAEEWVAEGLYQRAAQLYEEITEASDSEEIRGALINARKKRYEEDSTGFSAYLSALESAAGAYPLNTDFVGSLLEIYSERGNTEDAYNLICCAEKAGMTDETIIGQKNIFKYAYSLKSASYEDFTGVSGIYYSVCRKGEWGILGADGQTAVNPDYSYISPVSAEGIAVYGSGGESRLLNGSNMVLGIFPFEVTEAGMYSEGLVPVKHNGYYGYYDEFAKKRFGEYEYACSYQNGMAAVSKNGKQYIINKEGNEITDAFYRICCDKNGIFINGSVMVASKSKGFFEIYNEELEKTAEFSADDADVYKNGYIAFQSGGKWGFADTDGNVVISPEYDGAKSFSHGLAAVCLNGQWGFINTENKLVIDCVFDGADYFNSSGCCMVMTEAENPEEEAPAIKQWQLLSLKLGITEQEKK